MTVAMLMDNTLRAAKRTLEQSMQRTIKPLKLERKSQVPRCASSRRREQMSADAAVAAILRSPWRRRRSR